MEDQLGLSELLQGILGSEKELLSGDKATFHCAMIIDELEGLLEGDDIEALFWVNRHIEKEDRADLLLALEKDFTEAREIYEEKCQIDGIERHFLDGMQYVYCYLKGLSVDETTKTDTVKWFMSGRTKYKLGRVLIAHAIGFLLEARLQKMQEDHESSE